MKLARAYDLAYPEGVLQCGDVYMEIGAHKGRFLQDSKLLRTDCGYHLCEPSPLLAADLVSRFKRWPNVRIHNIAVDEFTGTVPLFGSSLDDIGGTLIPQPEKQPRCAVQVLTLGDLFSMLRLDRVRFLAINAEQSEYGIFRTATESLLKVDYIVCEFHPGKSGIDTKEFVAEHLAEQFETLAVWRENDPYNIWLGRNRACQNY